MLDSVFSAETLQAAIGFFESDAFWFWLKVLFFILSFLMVVAIILLLRASSWLGNKYLEDMTEVSTYRPYGAKKTFRQWDNIVSKVNSNRAEDYRTAIIEADNLLGEILRKMKYEGETVNDLLTQVDQKTIPNLDRLVSAHNFRNKIVHDPDIDLSQTETRQIISVYETAFRDLQMF